MATQSTIIQLRSYLQDVEDTDQLIQDDVYLALWLNLKDSDIRKAEAAIREAMTWWKANALSLMQQTFPSALSSKFPIFLDGISRAGLPVAYVRLTSLDIKGLLSEFKSVDAIRYVLQTAVIGQRTALEVNRSRYHQLGDEALKSAQGYVAIIDACGISRKHFPPMRAINMFVQTAREAVKLPAAARVAYIIGVSKLLLTIVKPLTPIFSAMGVTLRVYGTDEKSWEADLCYLIDRKALEEFRDRASKFRK